MATRPREDAPLRELTELARSAGGLVCAQLIAVRTKPRVATYLGRGKVEELAELVAAQSALLVIFDHDISPIQERNISQAIGCRVLDRTGLILDIFAQRATTHEGKLQVELAQLKHLATRLVRGWSHLERQKGGIGLRGPGESQLETDRRLLARRIKTLTARLHQVEAQRVLRRKARHRTPIPTISLVGYTNAGKSSLFRTLTGADVEVADKLFATLDPTMRRVQIAGFGAVVLSDTVGFIRALPHTLIAAFHSTLEEVTRAACLLLVCDSSHADQAELLTEVRRVLVEIGAADIPTILVNNKIDVTGTRAKTCAVSGAEHGVWLSAATGEGVDLLLAAIATVLGRSHHDYCLRLAPQAGALRAQLFARAVVQHESVEADGHITMRVKMTRAHMGWLRAQHAYRRLWDEIEAPNASSVSSSVSSPVSVEHGEP